jgi:hypothetical protein
MEVNGGYFTDDGEEINPDLIPKPGLCTMCRKDDDAKEEILCNLNRMDQRGDKDFKCFAYELKK